MGRCFSERRQLDVPQVIHFADSRLHATTLVLVVTPASEVTVAVIVDVLLSGSTP